ncbi:hypothetical protein BJ508DRAFT_359946 [Ascobolus immersus RN42]|uniref:Uncharacterized protein n=1 Tax=Ascobolus immersus RN42 TaxID=1160509 RepID=A0A3N4IDP8_ASCIM|nr:hypothetical protein BJ508DRAFT_359946 [Ascobolus immersus RN42]
MSSLYDHYAYDSHPDFASETSEEITADRPPYPAYRRYTPAYRNQISSFRSDRTSPHGSLSDRYGDLPKPDRSRPLWEPSSCSFDPTPGYAASLEEHVLSSLPLDPRYIGPSLILALDKFSILSPGCWLPSGPLNPAVSSILDILGDLYEGRILPCMKETVEECMVFLFERILVHTNDLDSPRTRLSRETEIGFSVNLLSCLAVYDFDRAISRFTSTLTRVGRSEMLGNAMLTASLERRERLTGIYRAVLRAIITDLELLFPEDAMGRVREPWDEMEVIMNWWDQEVLEVGMQGPRKRGGSTNANELLVEVVEGKYWETIPAFGEMAEKAFLFMFRDLIPFLLKLRDFQALEEVDVEMLEGRFEGHRYGFLAIQWHRDTKVWTVLFAFVILLNGLQKNDLLHQRDKAGLLREGQVKLVVMTLGNMQNELAIYMKASCSDNKTMKSASEHFLEAIGWTYRLVGRLTGENFRSERLEVLIWTHLIKEENNWELVEEIRRRTQKQDWFLMGGPNFLAQEQLTSMSPVQKLSRYISRNY